MGIYNNFKNWITNLGNKRLTDGSQPIIEDDENDNIINETNSTEEINMNNIEEGKSDNLENIQKQTIVKDEYKRINFNIRNALRDYHLWYSKPFHSSRETYGGQVAIFQAENEEIIILNYTEGQRDEQIVLGTADVARLPDGEVRQRRKDLSFRIDRLLCDMYREDEISKNTLGNSIYNIQENYGVKFTAEGLAVLNNPTRETITIDKTAVLLKNPDGKIVGCEKKEVPQKKEEKSTFTIFRKENKCKGSVSISCNKYDLSQFKDEASKKRAIVEHAENLSELFSTCNELGIFTGNENKSVALHRKIVGILEQEGLIEIGKDDIASIMKNMDTIRKIAYEYSVLAAFHYEDVILMHKHMPIEAKTKQDADKVVAQKDILNYVLDISKNELCYNLMTENMKETIAELQRHINEQKSKTESANENEFRASMKVNLNDLNKDSNNLAKQSEKEVNNQEKNIQEENIQEENSKD